MRSAGEPRPPEKIPDQLIATILSSSPGPRHYLRQLFMYLFDMTVHQASGPEAIADMDIAKMWNDLRCSTCLLDNPSILGTAAGACGHGYAHFQHLMGAYDAGYYSYLL